MTIKSSFGTSWVTVTCNASEEDVQNKDEAMDLIHDFRSVMYDFARKFQISDHEIADVFSGYFDFDFTTKPEDQ